MLNSSLGIAEQRMHLILLISQLSGTFIERDLGYILILIFASPFEIKHLARLR